MKTDIPEVRQTPFTSYVDSAMGACVEDAHGRLLAAFGYHPDGTPATDEAERTCKALNNAEADRALIADLVTAVGNLPCSGGGCGHPLYLHAFPGGCQGVPKNDPCGCIGGSPAEDDVIAALTAAKERSK